MPQCRLLVLQSTSFCNINCGYCYLPDRSSKGVMALDTVAAAVRRLFESGWLSPELVLAWHAGEPLAAPLEFYREATKIINRECTEDIRISQNFQTNGTLINQAWCDFFKLINARVGISIDGPAHLNDLNRLSRDGKSTFSKTIAGMRLLREKNIDYHVITVLTREALKNPQELYDFYVAEGVERVGFNIEEIEGANIKSSLDSPGVERELATFLRQFWNLNRQHRKLRQIREIDDMVARIKSPIGASVRNSLSEAFTVISVDRDGNISTFCPEFLGAKSVQFADFVFGNVHTTSLKEALESVQLREMEKSIATGIERCKAECDYFPVCGGGNPGNKWFERGVLDCTETMYCRLNVKVLGDIATEFLLN